MIRTRVTLFYIEILYDRKKYKIHKIKYNKGYRILKVILDSGNYPIKKEIEIPIDIYLYKNKIYADLDSVDLSKVEGYEEAKKIVECCS